MVKQNGATVVLLFVLLDLALFLPGCAAEPPPPSPKIAMPDPELLIPAPRISDLKTGDLDDLARNNREARARYVEEVTRRRGLIAYIRALRGEQ